MKKIAVVNPFFRFYTKEKPRGKKVYKTAEQCGFRGQAAPPGAKKFCAFFAVIRFFSRFFSQEEKKRKIFHFVSQKQHILERLAQTICEVMEWKKHSTAVFKI